MGYFIAFKAMQFQIKSNIINEIKQGLNPELITIITVSKKDAYQIEFKDDGKEIEYNGQLYDIINTKENNTSVTYYCFNDKKEKNLFSGMAQHISSHIATGKSSKDNNNKNLADDVTKVFFSTHYSFAFIIGEQSEKNSTINFHYKNIFIKTNSPPPEFV